jgi:ketosteroid isomerase-like protein
MQRRTEMVSNRVMTTAAAFALAAAFAFWAMPASAASSADEAMAAAQDLFAKMSMRDLASVSRYIPSEGFTEITPETDKLLQLDAKAFATLFQSGRRIALRAMDMQATVMGDAAIVTGKRVGYVTAADAADTPAEGRLAFTMVWSKRANAWQLRHIHLSTLGAGKP